MSAKTCRKGNHEVDEPVFTDPTLGGLIGWKCSCGALSKKSLESTKSSWVSNDMVTTSPIKT